MSAVRLREVKELVHESQASKEQSKHSGLLFCSSPPYMQHASSSTHRNDRNVFYSLPKTYQIEHNSLWFMDLMERKLSWINTELTNIYWGHRINLKFYSTFITEL